MADFIVSLLLLINVQYGHCAYYAPGVMQDVVAVRQAGWTAKPLSRKLPPVVGFVALPECSDINSTIWLFHESEGLSGPYLVADCADKVKGHDKQMRQRGIIVEVDHNTAIRWGVLGLGPQDINVAIIRYD